MSERPDLDLAVEAARVADWQQVVLNGGPPCFHCGDSDRWFCLRARRWDGHGIAHEFVPLEHLILEQRAQEAEHCADLSATAYDTFKCQARAAILRKRLTKPPAHPETPELSRQDRPKPRRSGS